MDSEGAPTKKPRQYGIDAFRLLSALPVIAAHGGRFHMSTHMVVGVLSKWSVPYFFLVLGYFLARQSGEKRTSRALERIFLMFLMASLLLLPLDLYQLGPYKTATYLAQHFLFNGSYYHLWYLDSLLIGLLVIRISDGLGDARVLPVVAIIALVASIWIGSYSSPGAATIGRHLMATPFLWFGMLLSARTPSMRQSVALVLAGTAILCAEAWVQYIQLHREIWHCPILFGTLPFAVGVFGIAVNLPYSRALETIGRLGGRYTGCMYVTHMYWIVLVAWAAQTLGMDQLDTYRNWVVPLVFLLTLGALRVVDRFVPSAIDALLGDKTAIRALARSIVALPKSALQLARARA